MTTAVKRSRNGKPQETPVAPVVPATVPPTTEAPSDTNGHANGLPTNGEAPKNNPPCYKVGPIMTGKGECVGGCVWERTFTTPDQREYKVHSISVEARYFSSKDNAWKPSSGFRPSQLSALEYVLRKLGDYVFMSRDSALRPKENGNGDEPIPF
jgi:hypothetical protein